MYARPFIDSLDFARNEGEISGEIPVAELPRLQEFLENQSGVVSYVVRGGVDGQGLPFLDVSLSGSCQLCCQRCLKAMTHQIRVETRLLLRDQAGMDALSEEVDEEEFDSILADTQLDLLNQLEEEILLGLPIAPRHEPGVCQVDAGAEGQKAEQNPFAVLAKLKLVK